MTKSDDRDHGTGSKATPSTGRRQGVVAPHPWPDQAARTRMSEQLTAHPSKKTRNRDYKRVPRGSLATD